MPIEPRQIVPTQYLTNVSALYYTVPTFYKGSRIVSVLLTERRFVNTDVAAAHAYTMKVIPYGGTDVAARIIASGITIPVNDLDLEACSINMFPGDMIYAHADANTAVTITINGVIVFR